VKLRSPEFGSCIPTRARRAENIKTVSSSLHAYTRVDNYFSFRMKEDLDEDEDFPDNREEKRGKTKSNIVAGSSYRKFLDMFDHISKDNVDPISTEMPILIRHDKMLAPLLEDFKSKKELVRERESRVREDPVEEIELQDDVVTGRMYALPSDCKGLSFAQLDNFFDVDGLEMENGEEESSKEEGNGDLSSLCADLLMGKGEDDVEFPDDEELPIFYGEGEERAIDKNLRTNPVSKIRSAVYAEIRSRFRSNAAIGRGGGGGGGNTGEDETRETPRRQPSESTKVSSADRVETFRLLDNIDYDSIKTTPRFGHQFALSSSSSSS